MKHMYKFMLGVSIASSLAFAQDVKSPVGVSLEEVWKMISNSAYSDKAEADALSAARAASERSSRHWLPTLYLDARTFQTNDPGTSFISLIEQRSLSSADFSVEAINHPEEKVYSRGALGVDLPLYEGGLKSAMETLSLHQANYQENHGNQVHLQNYIEVVTTYGQIGILQNQKQLLSQLQLQLEKIANSYKLGTKSNPVGYSGLLGIKALQNRLRAALKGNETQLEIAFGKLQELGFATKAPWSPVFSGVGSFVESYLSGTAGPMTVKGSELAGPSYTLRALKEQVKVAEQIVDVEGAKYKPRIGLFGENYIFRGSRSSSAGYTAGIYLQWNLFSPQDLGSKYEASLKASAARNSQFEAERRESIGRADLVEKSRALAESCRLLAENNQLLAEQFNVSETLFRNGSINVLQFVEMINRRADVVDAKALAETNYLLTHGQLIMSSPFQVENR